MNQSMNGSQNGSPGIRSSIKDSQKLEIDPNAGSEMEFNQDVMTPPERGNQGMMEIHERQMKRETYNDEVNIDLGRTKEDINYDRYQYSVGMKYDLRTKDLAYKRFKYIFDEFMTELF